MSKRLFSLSDLSQASDQIGALQDVMSIALSYCGFVDLVSLKRVSHFFRQLVQKDRRLVVWILFQRCHHCGSLDPQHSCLKDGCSLSDQVYWFRESFDSESESFRLSKVPVRLCFRDDSFAGVEPLDPSFAPHRFDCLSIEKEIEARYLFADGKGPFSISVELIDCFGCLSDCLYHVDLLFDEPELDLEKRARPIFWFRGPFAPHGMNDFTYAYFNRAQYRSSK